MVTKALVVRVETSSSRQAALEYIKRDNQDIFEDVSKTKKTKYWNSACNILSSIVSTLKEGHNGLYIFNQNDEKEYIYLNAMLGILYSLSGDNASSKHILEKIRATKNKGWYSISTSDIKKSSISDLFVSILEYKVGNKSEAALLALLKETKKSSNTLYCSEVDKNIVHTYLNAIKGVVEYQQGTLDKAKNMLELIDKNIPKSKFGLYGASTVDKSEIPDVGFAVSLLKYLVYGEYDSEEYLLKVLKKKSKSVSSEFMEGILYFVLSGKTL